MKKQLIFMTLLGITLFCSCNNQKSQVCEQKEIKTHTLKEVEDKEIAWESIFKRTEKHYFVYCYGPQCPHCNNIKNEIIEFALNNNETYFVKILADFDHFSQFNDETIGVEEIEYLTIPGTPTLIEISQSKVKASIVGENDIKTKVQKDLIICK